MKWKWKKKKLDIGWMQIVKVCTNVTSLNTNYCGKITSTTFGELTKTWIKLVSLSASWCVNFSLANLKTLASYAPNINTLHFALCRVDDSWIKILSKFPKLTFLNLAGNGKHKQKVFEKYDLYYL